MAFSRGIVPQALVESVDLIAKIANLDDGVVGLGELVANLEEQIELLGEILLADLDARIGHDFERRSVGFAEHRERT